MSQAWWESWHGKGLESHLPSSAIAGYVPGGGSTNISTGMASTIAEMTSTIAALAAVVAGKAALSHSHPIADVTGLASSLAGLAAAISTKAAGLHTHATADVTGLDSSLAGLAAAISTKAAGIHSHVSGDVTGLDSSLAGLAAAISTKAAGVHGHVTSDVTGLDSSLAGLATQISTKASLNSGLIPTAQLASGTPSASVFVRGDQTWAAPTAAPAAWSTTRMTVSYPAVRAFRISVTDASVTAATRRIQVQQETYDETKDNTQESDPLRFGCEPLAGSFILTAWGVDSKFGGIIELSYQVQ